MLLRVRPATASDADALHRLAALTFPLACTAQTPTEEKERFIAEHLSASSFLAYLVDPARVVLMVLDELSGAAVGYAMLVVGSPDEPEVIGALRHRPTAELSKFYVHPDHHGTEVAGLLMTAGLDAARGAGAAGVWLSVSEENERANAFYAKHGFEPVGRRRFHIGARWEDDFVRERAL